METEFVQLPNKTPLLFLTIPSTEEKNKETILMYGHLDKQPPLTESWDEGLHPYKPVIKDGKLYGRGSSDDGYAIFSALTAIKSLQQQGIPHSRIVVMIEASEESGSPHLPAYVEHLAPKIGTPNLVICLDSGSGNYEQMWLTSSLRGLIVGALRVDILKEGVHSGVGSGVVPDSFRIARQIISRLEDENTGTIKPSFLYAPIPKDRLDQTKICADTVGNKIYEELPFTSGATPISKDVSELMLNRNWRPQLTVTGIDGVPPVAIGGNVMRPFTSIKLSVRVPPGLNAKDAAEKLKALLEENPPYGARVSFDYDKSGSGWDAPQVSEWLNNSIGKASNLFYKKGAIWTGEGGSIPFMGMLGERFPKAQFVITGVLGPGSNAHGPNEFLHIDYAVRITGCVASIVADHGKQFSH